MRVPTWILNLLAGIVLLIGLMVLWLYRGGQP